MVKKIVNIVSKDTDGVYKHKSIEIEYEDVLENKIDRITRLSNLLLIKEYEYFEIGEFSPFEFGKELNMQMFNIQKGEREYNALSLYVGSLCSNDYDRKWMYNKNCEDFLNLNHIKIINYKYYDYIDFFGHKIEKNMSEHFLDCLYWVGMERSIDKIETVFKILESNKVAYFSDNSKIELNQSSRFARYFCAYLNGTVVWEENNKTINDVLGIIKNDLKIAQNVLFTQNDTDYQKHMGGMVKSLF